MVSGTGLALSKGVDFATHVARTTVATEVARTGGELRAVVLLITLLVPLASLGGVVSGGTAEEAKPLSIGAELDLNSRYVWHGQAWSEGAAANPWLWLSAGDFTFSAWSNYVLTKEPNQGQFNETDLEAAYEFSVQSFSFRPSFLYYFYPNQDAAESPGTGEVMLEFSYASGPVALEFTHEFDVIEYSGAYFSELGVSDEREFGERWSLESSAGLGYGSSRFHEVYVGVERSGLSAASVGLGLTYAAASGWYFRPHLEFSSLLSEDLRRAVPEPDLLNFGLAVGREF